MPRLFTGIEMPPEIAQRLTAFRGGLPGARWVEPENYHITLRFIGDVDEAVAADLFEALAERRTRGPLPVSLEALGSFGGVLALGGGAILAAETRELLRGQRVVYLSVELADAVSRVGLGGGRPLLAVNPRATLKFLLDQRRPLYEEVAVHMVRTDGRPPAEVVLEVLKHLS